MKNIGIRARVSDDFLKNIDKEAKRREMTRSDFIRLALENEIQRGSKQDIQEENQDFKEIFEQIILKIESLKHGTYKEQEYMSFLTKLARDLKDYSIMLEKQKKEIEDLMNLSYYQ
jgi:metal-responsive CopG/Arc/MetJ family transcriptional regulator